MFCKYCGNQLPDNAKFCPKCGKLTDDSSVNFTESETTAQTSNDNFNYYEPYNSYEPEPIILDGINNNYVNNNVKSEEAGSILKFSILGMVFSILFPILGLIFTIISKSKVKRFIAKYGQTEGKATVGKHLTIPALICSIFFMVYWFIYIIAILAIMGV